METKNSLNFPLMSPADIECRANTVREDGVNILLYKNARVDMRILDATVGVFDWQRQHQELKGVIYCGVSIRNPETGEWLTKWDAGKESRTEAEKGEASDSFKRACFNWGLGRELYTAPFIWINLAPGETYRERNSDKIFLSQKIKFAVADIKYNENREISYLKIVDNKGMTRYEFNLGGRSGSPKVTPASEQAPVFDAEQINNIKEATNIIQSCKTIEELRTFSAGLKKSNPDLWAIVERTATEKAKQLK